MGTVPSLVIPGQEVLQVVPWELVAAGGSAALLTLITLLAVRRGRAPEPAPPDEPFIEGPSPSGPVRVPQAPPAGLLAGLRERLSLTRAALKERLDRVFGASVDEQGLVVLEEGLIVADVGVTMTTRLIEQLRKRIRSGEVDPVALRASLVAEISAMLRARHSPLQQPGEGLTVVLVVGVNGSGKTTTIGKLAARWVGEGRQVVLAAADTYRAAAADQLAIWAERSGATLVRKGEGADPAAVVYEALEVARQRGAQVLIADTAGRLQSKRPLMDELGKIRRVIEKALGRPPDETLLVIDGTMGQNALAQARAFHEVTPLTGVVVTKLDGTAKGGIMLAIAAELAIPVKLIGVGEKIEDLRDFDPDAFVEALL